MKNKSGHLTVAPIVTKDWFPIFACQRTHLCKSGEKNRPFYQWMTWWMICNLQGNQTGSFEVNDKVQGWLRCGICFMETPSTCPHLAGQHGHAPFAPTHLSAASCLAELLPKFLDPLCRAWPGNKKKLVPPLHCMSFFKPAVDKHNRYLHTMLWSTNPIFGLVKQ